MGAIWSTLIAWACCSIVWWIGPSWFTVPLAIVLIGLSVTWAAVVDLKRMDLNNHK